MIKAGQKLYDERKRRGFSLEEVASATKIRQEFLSAIEKGEYHKLPSPSYAQGFVRSYTKFLELPEKETLALFRREFDGEKDQTVLPESLAGKKDMPIRRFKVRQVFLIGGFVFILLAGYIGFQFRYAFISPPLDVSRPSELAVLDASTVTVEGKTDPGSTVSVEEAQVPVDEEGNFKKELIVFPGKTTISVKSTNRFGKQTSVERHITIK